MKERIPSKPTKEELEKMTPKEIGALARARWEFWLKSGYVEKLGSYEYRVNVDHNPDASQEEE